MPGTPGAVREGPLGVRKRKGVEVRYFVLYEDRLDYYYREEEATSEVEPRGRLTLSDIRSLEASPGELAFHLDSQTLVLSAVEGSDLQAWAEDLQAMLSAGGCGEEIPWEEVSKRLPTAQDSESRAARSEIFERLDHNRTGLLDFSEVGRALLERLEAEGGDCLVPDPSRLEPAARRAVGLAADFASQAYGFGSGAECLDRRGFHAALTYFSGYIQLCAHFKKADSSGEVDYTAAAGVMEEWGIPLERAEQRFPGGLVVKFEDFTDWLLWCRLEAAEFDEAKAHSQANEGVQEQEAQGRQEVNQTKEDTEEELRAEAAETSDDAEEAGEGTAILCQGALNVEIGGRVSRRHHVLFVDRLCYYEEEADVREGKDPRGSIPLGEVEAVEDLEQGFRLLLKNSSLTEFQAGSRKEGQGWLHAWALALQRDMGVSFARAKHKSIYQQPQPDDEDASKADQATIVCEGSVEMMKKNKTEQRYFMLFDRHFEYYNCQEEFAEGAPPRCRVALEDVQDVEVRSGGSLVVQLSQGKTFEMNVGGQDDARRWGRAWDRAMSEGISVSGAGTVSWGNGWQETAVATPVATTPPPRGCTGGTFTQAGAVAEAWPEPDRQKRELSKQPSVSWDLKVDMVEEEYYVLHEGVVVMGRGEDNLQPRFAVVLKDRLEYTSDWGTESKVAGPRTRILRSQIRDAEVVDEGFNLELEDGLLLMRTSSEAEQQAWLMALERMLNDQDSGGRPTNGHAPGHEASRPVPLLQATLGVECGGQLERKHCVLYPDCLEHYGSRAEAASGCRPHGVIWKRDMKSLEVLNSEFVIHAGESTVVLCTDDRSTFIAWQKALLPMFGGGDGGLRNSWYPGPPLCQGNFRVCWGVGDPETEELVLLRRDRLECGGGQLLPTQEIEDVEVIDEGFVFHGRDGCRVSLRFADGASEMETWLSALGCVLDGEQAAAAGAPMAVSSSTPAVPSSGSRSSRELLETTPCRKLCRTSSDLAAGPTRCVHEGPLELEPWRGQRRPRHAVLYGTKLDLFGAAEEADGGLPPCLSLPIDGIQELRVLDLAFELCTSTLSAARQLRVPTRRDFEDWLRALSLVLGGDAEMERRADGRGWFRRLPLGSHRSSMPAMRRSNSQGGRPLRRACTSGHLPAKGRVLHQGPLALVRHGRTEAFHFVALPDRLEYFADAPGASSGAGRRGVLRPADVREVRVLEHGFVLGLAHESLELHVASARDMDVWVKVLRTVLDPTSETEGRRRLEEEQFDGREEEEELEGTSSYFSQASFVCSQDGSGSSAARLHEWLDSLQERPLHRGELGFQDSGRLTKRFCVLFKDRLDCWELMSQVGSKPSVRVPLGDVRGLEIVSSGFVLNSRGRRTGVHVSNNEDLQAWTRALLSVLAPSESSEATTPATPQTSVPSTPTPSASTSRPSRPRSASSMQGRASATTRALRSSAAALRSKSPGSPRPAPFVPRVANVAPGAGARGQSPERQQLSLHSARDPHRSVKTGRPRPREAGGGWACRDVAGKIIEPVPGRSPLLQQREERGALAEKVTGSRVAAAQRGSSEISGKITEPAEGGRGQRARGVSPSEAVAPKVTEVGRVSMASARSVPAHGMPEKITQAKATRRSAPQLPGRPPSQPLGLPGHAPGFLA